MIKNSKIKHIVLGCLVAFSCFILLFLFLMQIVFLNKYYEVYKKNQLDDIVNSIKTNNSMDINTLEDIAYNYGVCVSIYSNGVIQTISNTYNKGCLFSDKDTSDNYITSFVSSGKTEDTKLLYNKRFGNKTIIKALKYNNEVYIFLNTSIQPLDSSIILLKSQYGYIALIIFGISLIISYVISSQISRPIVKISDSAKKLANGDFNVSFSTDSKVQEIKELSTTLDLAKNELSKTDELRRDLMANVGHDLRTPLTMIKAYAEMTRDLESQTPEKRVENMNIIIEETDRLNVLVSDILDLSKLQSSTYELKIEEFDLNELIRNIIKRLFDIVIGLFALPFVLLFICILGPIIYFSDKGTIFYKAKRIGQGGKMFGMYKFRSMIMNAPDIRLENGDTYNGDDDPRVTQIGRFMRKTSLDEIPQFLNVLNGTMSFIGPRPDTPDFLHVYEEKYPSVLTIKPGITGYNQAYFRNSIDGAEKMRNDNYYAEHLTFWMDVKIVFKTIKTVLFRENVNH